MSVNCVGGLIRCQINTNSKKDKLMFILLFLKGAIVFATFYYIKSDYIQFLQIEEMKERGFTCVPNVTYANKTKFVYGVVMEIDSNNHKIPYFVPISSYSKRQTNNILIFVKNTKDLKAVGALRFNYMIPVPSCCLEKVDFNNPYYSTDYKILLEQEYRYIKKKIKLTTIQRMARETYYEVTNKTNINLIKNSCDFKILEKAYWEYCSRKD